LIDSLTQVGGTGVGDKSLPSRVLVVPDSTNETSVGNLRTRGLIRGGGDTTWPTALDGEARGEISPVPGSAVAADEHRPTYLSATFLFHSDVAWAGLPWGGASTPLPSRYVKSTWRQREKWRFLTQIFVGTTQCALRRTTTPSASSRVLNLFAKNHFLTCKNLVKVVYPRV